MLKESRTSSRPLLVYGRCTYTVDNACDVEKGGRVGEWLHHLGVVGFWGFRRNGISAICRRANGRGGIKVAPVKMSGDLCAM